MLNVKYKLKRLMKDRKIAPKDKTLEIKGEDEIKKGEKRLKTKKEN